MAKRNDFLGIEIWLFGERDMTSWGNRYDFLGKCHVIPSEEIKYSRAKINAHSQTRAQSLQKSKVIILLGITDSNPKWTGMKQATVIHPLRNKLKREHQIHPDKELYRKVEAKKLPRGITQWVSWKNVYFLLKADTLLERGQHNSVKQGNMQTYLK